MNISTFRKNDSDSNSADTFKIKRIQQYFNSKIEYFKNLYNPGALMEKIKKFSKKAGATTVYYVLLLYYALGNKNIPLAKRMTVLAALGYFISPLDFIPDMLPAGLVDDGAILMYALQQVYSYIDEETDAKARRKLHEWFGEQDIVGIQDLPFIGKK